MQQPPGGYPQQPQYPQYPQGGYPQQPPPPQRKGTSPLVIVLAILGGLLVLGFGGCLLCVGVAGKGIADAEKKASEEKAEAKKNVKKLELDEMLADYKGNEVAADKKYKGKFVEISGVAREIKKDITDDTYIEVGVDNEAFSIPNVHCELGKKGEDEAAKLKKGQKITVRGIVTGLMMDVQLKDCEVQ